jgi:hypothetical protein
LVIASALFAVAIRTKPPTQNVLLGIATSFVFVIMLDILLLAQQGITNIARVRFFGPELVRGTATFAYPDFEPHRDVKRALHAAKIQMRYQRPTSRIRGFADFWIDVPAFAASNDIEAILYVSGIFGGIAAHPDALMTDRAVIDACDRSFLSFGLSSSVCTYLYLEHAGQHRLFDFVAEAPGAKARKFARTCDGRDFHSDDVNEYGVILRYAPDRRNHPGRRWFIIGGLGPEGTRGAAWYLAQHWRHLARLTAADQDFVAFISVPVMAPRSARFDIADICTNGTRRPQMASRPGP